MDIIDYIECTSESRRQRLISIINLIKQLYPTVQESMKYKMPTYEFGGGWIAVANQKNYLSVYTCSAEHISSYKIVHPEIKTGKACINFRDTDSIDFEQLKIVILNSIGGIGRLH